MFAVKSAYSIGDAPDKTIPLYVANNEIYFARTDIADEVYGSLFGILSFKSFENYDGDFANFIDVRDLFLEKPERFMQFRFWLNTFSHQNFHNVIAEVTDAQHFVKEYFRLDLPQDWCRLNVDAIIDDLSTRSSDWIEKCYKSLQILATNDEQKKLARCVYDEAWKIIRAREKDNRPTLHDTLVKFGLSNDDLIQALLERHETKFCDEQARRKTEFEHQRDELKNDLARLLK